MLVVGKVGIFEQNGGIFFIKIDKINVRISGGFGVGLHMMNGKEANIGLFKNNTCERIHM